MTLILIAKILSNGNCFVIQVQGFSGMVNIVEILKLLLNYLSDMEGYKSDQNGYGCS